MDSKGGDLGGNVSGDEAAAWRDLIARYDLPADVDAAHAPWPDAENLSDPATAPQPTGAVDQEQRPDQRPGADHDRRPADGGGAATNESMAGAEGHTAGADGHAAGTDAHTAGVDGRTAGLDGRTAGLDGRTAGLNGRAAGADEPDQQPGSPAWDGPSREAPDRARVIRHAAPPPQQPDDDADDRYIPPPPPPLPNLDPVAKGAWTALAGGPAYLLVATIAGWQIPGWAALLAVAAFVTGFTLIVLRMSDKHPEDDDNNGAVL